MLSGTSISVGTVAAFDWIGMASYGSIDAVSINAGNDVLLGADGAIHIAGPITSGASNRLVIGGADLVDVGGGVGESFDRNLIFQAVDTGASHSARRGADDRWRDQQQSRRYLCGQHRRCQHDRCQ